MHPKIIALETTNPVSRFTQSQALECVQKKPGMTSSQLKWYERFLSDPGVSTRFFGLDQLPQIYEESPDQALMRFQRVATQIGSQALESALHASGLHAKELDGLIVTTCTGYLCPGLTSYIAGNSGLRSQIFSLDLAGTGCGAALPALQAASQFLEAHPHSTVAVVCAEVCSAAIFWGEEIDLILSNSIFSDGAACVILSNRPEDSGLAMVNFESLLWPEYRDDLRFKTRDARLCNVISRKVPGLASQAVESIYKQLGGDGNEWLAVHPGGRKVLDAIEAQIPEFRGKLTSSRKVLRDYGNMSSPSILFVLKELMASEDCKPGDKILLFSFGAGFSAFGISLRYEPFRFENAKQNLGCAVSLG